MSQSKQSQTSSGTQIRDPYAPAKPLLDQASGQIGAYLANPNSTQAYTGQRVAGMSDMTRSGLDQLGAAAGAGQSSGYLSKVLSGDYLNQGNPYQDALDKKIVAGVMPNINNTFSSSGMVGSTLHQGTLTDALTSGLAQSHYGNYQQERAAQQSAAQMLPTIDAQAASQRIAAGQGAEAYTQAQLDAAQQAWREQQMAPLQAAANAMPYINQIANAGGTQSSNGTTTTTSQPGLAQQLMGGAMMGASILGAPATGGASLGLFGRGAGTMMPGTAANGGWSSSVRPTSMWGF